jgi:hypothetical protein
VSDRLQDILIVHVSIYRRPLIERRAVTTVWPILGYLAILMPTEYDNPCQQCCLQDSVTPSGEDDGGRPDPTDTVPSLLSGQAAILSVSKEAEGQGVGITPPPPRACVSILQKLLPAGCLLLMQCGIEGSEILSCSSRLSPRFALCVCVRCCRHKRQSVALRGQLPANC